MELFYCNTINETHAIFDEQESTHCIRVLRHKAGDRIIFTDGKGKRYVGGIETPHPKNCVVKIESSEEEQAAHAHLHIAIAPPKAIDRFEWFLEKATELGVNEVTPLLCRYSERKHLNMERCEKILVSSMKQSNRLFVPQFNAMMAYNSFMQQPLTGTKLIAHCEPSEKKMMKNIAPFNTKITILIGPEGDFSKEEIEKAVSEKFEEITLGEKRLRTETAAIHVCSAVNLLI